MSNPRELLAATARRYAACEVQGVTYRLRSLSAMEFARVQGVFAKHAADQATAVAQSNAMLLRMAIVGEDDNPVFGDADLDGLLAIDHGLFDRLADAAASHCRIDEADLKKN